MGLSRRAHCAMKGGLGIHRGRFTGFPVSIVKSSQGPVVLKRTPHLDSSKEVTVCTRSLYYVARWEIRLDMCRIDSF